MMMALVVFGVFRFLFIRITLFGVFYIECSFSSLDLY